METRATRMGRVADSLKALEAARAKREHRAEAAVRDKKAAAGPPPDEQPRRDPRAEVKLAAAVIGPGGRAVYGWVLNVSHGGCYVACAGPFVEGDACTVRLTLPPDTGGGVLDLPARVARLDGGGMGLAFDGPADEAARVLAALVDAYDVTLG